MKPAIARKMPYEYTTDGADIHIHDESLDGKHLIIQYTGDLDYINIVFDPTLYVGGTHTVITINNARTINTVRMPSFNGISILRNITTGRSGGEYFNLSVIKQDYSISFSFTVYDSEHYAENSEKLHVAFDGVVQEVMNV